MKRLAPFIFVSVAVHLLALMALGLAIRPETGIAGSPDGDEDRVFVVVHSEQDYTPVAENPGAMDSPESTDSRKEELEKEVEPEDYPELLTQDTPEAPVVASDTKLEDIPEIPPEITEPVKKQLKEQEESQQSIAQIASNPLTRRSALGQELHDFQSKLLAAIRQCTFFPQEALHTKRYGQVTLAFAITRDGTLCNLRVVTSSGSDVLDGAAQEILQRAAQVFPAFPAGLREESLAYTVPIHFRPNRSTSASGTISAPSQ